MEFAARDEFLILTYPLSCLQRIENSDQPLILKIVVTLHQLVGSSKRVIVVWLPSHTGLAGNMTIDAVAKVALNLAESQTPVPFTGFYPLMSTHIGNGFGTPKPITSESVRTLRWSFPNPYNKIELIDHSRTSHPTYAPRSWVFAEEGRPTWMNWLSVPSDGVETSS